MVSCQNEKSQLQNREQALRILRARLLAAAQEEADTAAGEARRSQVRTVDRSERIRTYNYAENRISDHRTGYKAYNLDVVLDGDLQPVIESAVEADLEARLAAVGRVMTRGARSSPRPSAGWPTPAWPAPRPTPRSCWPTSSAPTAAGSCSSTRSPTSDRATYDALVGRRAAREPLQHLTGRAYFRHVELAVGPGVFVPRPETELLAGWAVEQAGDLDAAGRRRPRHRLRAPSPRPSPTRCLHARVHAVEMDEAAHGWATINLAGTGVDLRLGDLGTAFDELAGTVDVVVSNPPYIPLDAWESVALEVRDHDPALALWSGADGLDAMRVVEARAALLLGPGGVVGVEHADAQGESAPAVFAATGRWADVRDHRDLAGRPRFVTARLAR